LALAGAAAKIGLAMFGRQPTRLPLPVAFLLVPQFSMMSFASAVEPLRSANRMSGSTLYSWHILSPDGAPVAASNGIGLMPSGDISQAAAAAMLVVCAGMGGHRYADAGVLGWLRRLDRQGLVIGGVSLGSYLLARAGLLAGYRSTVHWENLAAFAEEFPDLEVTNELFEIDRNRFTCSGGIAALDLMLDLIARQHGRDLAKAVSEQFIQERIRDRHDRQRMALPARLGVRHPKLLEVVRRMEESAEEPIARARLAAGVGLSSRQLERLFRRYLDRTPTRYYLELRLARARLLLLQTELPVLEVALACGFVSASHFSKCYRDVYGCTPRDQRQADA
jgi:transcriptional regulator GlxA family with amidase domain